MEGDVIINEDPDQEAWEQLDSWVKFTRLKVFYQHQYKEDQKSRNIWIRDWKMAEEIAKNLSLSSLTDEVEKKKQAEKVKYHRHKEGRCGASDLGSCIYLRACKRAGVKLPEVKGLKAEKGAFETGDIFHENVQTKVVDIIKEKKYPLFVAPEIMVETAVTNKTIMESPVDIGLTTKPIKVQKWPFKDGEFEINTNPDGVWLRVWDIKSASDFGFYKVKAEGVKFHWKAQFHAYMKACHLKELTVHVIHKEKLYKQDIVVPWEDSVWERVVKKMERVEVLSDEIKKQLAETHSFSIDLSKDDLEYFDSEIEQDADDICWWSCPFTTCHEETDDKGKTRLILDMPCPPATSFLRTEAEEKFAVNQMWKRGASHITIDDIDWDNELITSHNKKGTAFKDSIYAALKQFEPLEGK